MRKTALLKTSSRLSICGMLLLCLVQAPRVAQGQNAQTDRLLGAGLDLFPSFLAADQQLTDKLDKDGFLLLYIVHHNNQRGAQIIATQLKDIKQIRGAPLRVVILRDHDALFPKEQPAAIFIAQPSLPHLAGLVLYGKEKGIITFSPFAGDITQGVSGSITVTARILPQVNMTTLAESGLRLKPFFLRIASPYPEVERP